MGVCGGAGGGGVVRVDPGVDVVGRGRGGVSRRIGERPDPNRAPGTKPNNNNNNNNNNKN